MAFAGSVHLGFSGIGGGDMGGGVMFTSLSLHADFGAESIRVDWGAPDILSTDPQIVTYLPATDGSIEMPGPGLSRGYADGDYVIKIRATLVASLPEKAIDPLALATATTTLTVFADSNNTSGVAKTGDGRDNLMAGGSGGDSFSGLAGDDWLSGGGGNDSVNGGDGNDFLGGNAGNDTIDGGAGNDAIFGDDGDDSLIGNTGNDYMGAGAGNDAMSGGTGNDTMYGGNGAFGGEPELGNDTLLGGTGNDQMDGEAGNDSLNGGTGLDSLTGGDGNDSLVGGDDDDWLFGNDGADRLNGSAGSDTVNGGLGKDIITSQADGALDLFVYGSLAEGGDKISGFEHGIDKFLLFMEAVDAAHFIAPGTAMTDASTYIIYDAAAGKLSVDADGSGAGKAVLLATLTGAPTVTHDDIWFAAVT